MFFFCRGYEDIKHAKKDIECKQIEVTARLEKQEKELNWYVLYSGRVSFFHIQYAVYIVYGIVHEKMHLMTYQIS